MLFGNAEVKAVGGCDAERGKGGSEAEEERETRRPGHVEEDFTDKTHGPANLAQARSSLDS